MRSTSAGLLAISLLSGCANLSTLQDPETVPKQDFELGFGGTFTRYRLRTTVTTTTSTGTTTKSIGSEGFTVPALIVSGRYGATDNLEVHGNIWLPLGATLGVKYMLVGDRKKGGFAFSPGIDLSAPLSISIDNRTYTLFDLYVPLHMGYRTAPNFAIYWTPKYALRLLGTDIGHVAGGNLGVAIGEKTQVMLEGGAFYDTLVKNVIITGGVGVGFR